MRILLRGGMCMREVYGDEGIASGVMYGFVL